ncbi:peptidyl-arginine deiminase domain protein [Aspergillus pseudotamarii]|uniref:Peptidyl-arginine deiminase domain protein n=1 Tax=Aspergillus pseudotamarii TaxID=132259 RepID=A0A5N6SXN1_ASPPS|nr:peptidyl-arginine deiminase domain protein [Aspergillus pseudotamarii]KAE8138667.1 peptidyl-arginine deiminase domain protein [Aspergillus pseudotamarii]
MGGYLSTNRTSSSTNNTEHHDSPPKSDAPLEAGQFTFPPEWHPHLATMMGFPSRASCLESLWEKNCEEIVDIAAAIADFELVRLYTRPEDIEYAQDLVNRKVRIPSKVHVIPIPINHCWVRDTGPVYVHDATGKLDPRQRFAIDFKFNEWGNKNGWEGTHGHYRYGNPCMTWKQLQENTEFAHNVISADQSPSPVQRIVPKIRAEGGGLVVDGEGTLIVAESYMVCEQRNPGQSRDEIEEELRRLLGVEKVIWVPGRKNLDITDCHLDAEVRFVRPGVIVMTRHSPDAVDGPEWIRCGEEILEALMGETDANGRPFEIFFIDEPDPKSLGILPKDEFVSSYLNSYFCNGGLIIPAFGSETYDRKALETWQTLLPDCKVRQVPIRTIPLSGGVIHCVTQQVPSPES